MVEGRLIRLVVEVLVGLNVQSKDSGFFPECYWNCWRILKTDIIGNIFKRIPWLMRVCVCVCVCVCVSVGVCVCVCWGNDGSEEVEAVWPAKIRVYCNSAGPVWQWLGQSSGKGTDDQTDLCIACGLWQKEQSSGRFKNWGLNLWPMDHLDDDYPGHSEVGEG